MISMEDKIYIDAVADNFISRLDEMMYGYVEALRQMQNHNDVSADDAIDALCSINHTLRLIGKLE